MSDFEDQFKGVLLLWLQKKAGIRDAVRVRYWDDYAYSGYGCETCGPDIEYSVEICYDDSDGTCKGYTYNGKFTDLINDLVRIG